MEGYIYFTEFLALDKVHLHKDNEYHLFCAATRKTLQITLHEYTTLLDFNMH